MIVIKVYHNLTGHTHEESPKYPDCQKINETNELESIDTTSSNIDRRPSKIVNDQNVCVYYDSINDSFYGSFRKRPKFPKWPNLKGTENEVIMRLKAGENEFESVTRYESILRPPLFQQVVVSKHQNDYPNPSSSNSKKTSVVASMVEVFSHQVITNNQQEELIDLDLLNSIRKDVSLYPYGKSIRLMQALEINRYMRWIDMEQVQAKGLLRHMTKEEVKFQESQFEIISTEASYNKSLSVLVDKFYNSPQLSIIRTSDFVPVIKAHQKEHLFSNILKIYAVSCKFLASLEKRFCESVKIIDLCDIVAKFADKDFEVYVPYIQNQRFQSEAYNDLKKDSKAAAVIEELESQSECCALSLDSFLLLPMQRLLRILLLLKSVKENICSNRKYIIESVDRAITNIDKVIEKCSEKKNYIDERQRMLEICRFLVFKSGHTKPHASLGNLIHEGEVKRSTKNSLSRIWPDFLIFKCFWFILTSEYLLMTRISRGKEISYIVEDHYKLSELSVEYESSDGNELCLRFRLVVNKSQRNNDFYLIQTKSKEDFNKWISLLQQA